MATGHEIALQLLPIFAENVLARNAPRTYGYYAKAIGRDPAKGSLAIGPAMHSIGALCVFRQLPVAPLYWVCREGGEQRKVFASDPLESRHILEKGRFDTMFVAAREYRYSMTEFEKLQDTLKKVFTSQVVLGWTPHHLWHMAITMKSDGQEQTYLECAMSKYEKLIAELRAERKQGSHAPSHWRQPDKNVTGLFSCSV